MFLKAALDTGLSVWVGLSCSVDEAVFVKMLSADTVTECSQLDFADTLDSRIS